MGEGFVRNLQVKARNLALVLQEVEWKITQSQKLSHSIRSHPGGHPALTSPRAPEKEGVPAA